MFEKKARCNKEGTPANALPKGLHIDRWKSINQKRKVQCYFISLMFLTEKRDGTNKAYAYADRRKQREYMSKEAVAAPTMMLESIFVTAAIEAKEGRDVAVMDLPGAFFDADNDDEVIMTIKGKLAELMVMMAPQIY